MGSSAYMPIVCLRVWGRVLCESVMQRAYLKEHNSLFSRGGGVLPRILDRGVPRRFVDPNPIYGLRKRKRIPFLGPKAEK